IGQRQRAAKTQAVGDCATKYGQEPDEASEQPSEAAGLFHPEVQSFVQVARQRCEGGVIGESFEEFANVGDPEGTLESSTNLAQSFRKSQSWLPHPLCNFPALAG